MSRRGEIKMTPGEVAAVLEFFAPDDLPWRQVVGSTTGGVGATCSR